MTIVSLGGTIPFPPIVSAANGTSGVLDAANEYIAYVLQVPETGTLKKVAIRVNAVTVADPINVRIETVDASTGYPSGTLYATGATGSIPTPSSSTVYWVEINGSSGISVTAGDVIAVKMILDYTDGNIAFLYSNQYLLSGNAYFPYVVTYIGETYSKNAASIQLALQYSDKIYSSHELICSANTFATFNSSSSPNHRGLKITIPVGLRVVGLWFTADIDNPADLILYGTDGTTVLASYSIDPDIRSGTSANIFCVHFAPVTLTKDGTYRIILKPTTTSNITISYFTPRSDGSYTGVEQFVLGQNAVYTSGSPGSWTEDTGKRPFMGLIIDGIDIPASSGGLANSIIGSNIVRRVA